MSDSTSLALSRRYFQRGASGWRSGFRTARIEKLLRGKRAKLLKDGVQYKQLRRKGGLRGGAAAGAFHYSRRAPKGLPCFQVPPFVAAAAAALTWLLSFGHHRDATGRYRQPRRESERMQAG